jgi:hypothetical protein
MTIAPHHPLWITFVESLIIPLLIIVPILYMSAGICFLFIRFFRPETESKMKRFLGSHRPFFIRLASVDDRTNITKQMMKKAGARGWAFASLPAIDIMYSLHGTHWNYWTFLIITPMLFFGGLFFAYSWYGIRCLRLLGLDSY